MDRADALEVQPAVALPQGKDSLRYPIEQRIEDKKRGIGRQRYPFVAWTLTGLSNEQVEWWVLNVEPLVAMVGVFIWEAVVNWKAQGTPFSFHVGTILGHYSDALLIPHLAYCQPHVGTVNIGPDQCW
jgi:hypothetical protein